MKILLQSKEEDLILTKPQVLHIKYSDSGPQGMLLRIERAARQCTDTLHLIKKGSAEKMCKTLIKRGHTSMLEFASIDVHLRLDIRSSRELNRHRHLTIAEKSTRYCNMSNGGEIEFIDYGFEGSSFDRNNFLYYLTYSETLYKALIKDNKPEMAACVLPLCTASYVQYSANVAHWRHILRRRVEENSHPVLKKVMKDLLKTLKDDIPVLFNDIGNE